MIALRIPSRVPRDPRYFQIVSLLLLCIYGVASLDFPVSCVQIGLILTLSLLAQWVCGKYFRLKNFDFRSPLISGLSLCLLLRTGSFWLAGLAAVIAIGSKFLIRIRGKHIFNPTNFGIVCLLVLDDGAWVSPGQWGNVAWFAFLLVCLGGLVAYRSSRSDISLAFLVAYCLMLYGRAIWLGDPISIPFHQLQNGGLLIFTFFMISDPKTTPNTRAGRMIYAVLVAAVSNWIQFGLFHPNGFLFALVCLAPHVPLIDRLFPGQPYHWPGYPELQAPIKKGESHVLHDKDPCGAGYLSVPGVAF